MHQVKDALLKAIEEERRAMEDEDKASCIIYHGLCNTYHASYLICDVIYKMTSKHTVTRIFQCIPSCYDMLCHELLYHIIPYHTMS